MYKKYLTLILPILVINLACGVLVFADTTKEDKDAEFAQKVKREVTRLGTGTDAKIEVKLKDGTKLEGYVSEITNDHFVVEFFEKPTIKVAYEGEEV